MERIESFVREGGIVSTQGCCGDASKNTGGWKPPRVATCWGVKPSSQGANISPFHVVIIPNRRWIFYIGFVLSCSKIYYLLRRTLTNIYETRGSSCDDCKDYRLPECDAV